MIHKILLEFLRKGDYSVFARHNMPINKINDWYCTLDINGMILDIGVNAYSVPWVKWVRRGVHCVHNDKLFKPQLARVQSDLCAVVECDCLCYWGLFVERAGNLAETMRELCNYKNFESYDKALRDYVNTII